MVDHPTNNITMVVPFAGPTAKLWGISLPHPLEPLREGFLTGQRRVVWLGFIYFNVLAMIRVN
jgi:hypothetical protein